jgi:alpha-1,2-mannosyltransferase
VNTTKRRLLAASALGVFAAASVLGSLDLLLNQNRVSPDFKSYYAAFRAAAERRSFYAADELRAVAREAEIPGRTFPYLYPPFFAYAAQPLAGLKLQRAQWLWSLASAVAMGLVAMLAVLTSEWPSRTEPAGDRIVPLSCLALLLLLLFPVQNNLMLGQINILVLVFVTWAFYAAAREHDLLAGASLGVAAMIKLSPAILICLFLAQRRVRTLAGMALSALACVGISLALGAASAWAEYPAFVLERMSSAEIPALSRVDVLWNFSLKACSMRLLPESPTLAPLLANAGAFGILGVLIYAAAKTREISGSIEVLALGFLALMVMASPLSYVHHVIFLFPGAVLAWGSLSRSDVPNHVRDQFLLILCILVYLVSRDFPAIAREAHLPEALSSANLFALIGLVLLSLRAAQILWRRAVAEEAPA